MEGSGAASEEQERHTARLGNYASDCSRGPESSRAQKPEAEHCAITDSCRAEQGAGVFDNEDDEIDQKVLDNMEASACKLNKPIANSCLAEEEAHVFEL